MRYAYISGFIVCAVLAFYFLLRFLCYGGSVISVTYGNEKLPKIKSIVLGFPVNGTSVKIDGVQVDDLVMAQAQTWSHEVGAGTKQYLLVSVSYGSWPDWMDQVGLSETWRTRLQKSGHFIGCDFGPRNEVFGKPSADK
jgi:hypothetical protein